MDNLYSIDADVYRVYIRRSTRVLLSTTQYIQHYTTAYTSTIKASGRTHNLELIPTESGFNVIHGFAGNAGNYIIALESPTSHHFALF